MHCNFRQNALEAHDSLSNLDSNFEARLTTQVKATDLG